MVKTFVTLVTVLFKAVVASAFLVLVCEAGGAALVAVALGVKLGTYAVCGWLGFCLLVKSAELGARRERKK